MHKYNEVKDFYNKKGYDVLIKESEYKKATQKFICVDKEGYYYETSFKIFRLNRIPYKFSKNNPYTIKNINHWIEINNHKDTIELISKNFNGIIEVLEWKCLLCNNNFKRCLNDMIQEDRNKYCKDCSRRITGENKTDSNLKDIFEENGYKLISEYKNSNNFVNIEDIYGYKYRTSRNSFIKIMKENGNLCKFHSNNPYTINNIKNYIKINNIKVELLSEEYTNKEDLNLTFLCLECGKNTFTTKWNSFLSQNKVRCDKCTSSQSISSYLIEEEIKKINITYSKEYRINECRNVLPLPFDFAIFDKNNKLLGLIEVDGEQHFKPSRYGFGNISKEEAEIKFKELLIRDNIKNEYCIKNNIPILRISYYDIKCSRQEKIIKEFIENIL